MGVDFEGEIPRNMKKYIILDFESYFKEQNKIMYSGSCKNKTAYMYPL